jgi:hypothetical protein
MKALVGILLALCLACVGCSDSDAPADSGSDAVVEAGAQPDGSAQEASVQEAGVDAGLPQEAGLQEAGADAQGGD